MLEAGAGAGKTSTLVARCVAELCAESNPVSLDELLMVTFTEAAAAEMRRRIREALTDRAAREPANQRLAEQLALLDQARIGTLHSFCFRLVRESSRSPPMPLSTLPTGMGVWAMAGSGEPCVVGRLL